LDESLEAAQPELELHKLVSGKLVIVRPFADENSFRQEVAISTPATAAGAHSAHLTEVLTGNAGTDVLNGVWQ
jgi:hypothetical protein